MKPARMTKAGAILLTIGSIGIIIMSIINLNETFSYMLNADPAGGMLEQHFSQVIQNKQAVILFMLMGYVSLAISSVFSVVKIIVGLLILKKAERSRNFYLIWSILFLIFGLYAVKTVGLTTLGFCHLVSGVIGPVLLIVGSIKMKREQE